MKKQIIKLNESQLNGLVTKMVTESMKHILKENEYTECGVWDILDELKKYMSSDDILSRLIARLEPLQVKEILNDIKLIELGDKLDDENENIFETKTKKQPKKGTIGYGDGRVDATEDGVDKYGNPMYKVKKSPSIKGRTCKDGNVRVQAFDFLPYKN